jgi:hypothetical protein
VTVVHPENQEMKELCPWMDGENSDKSIEGRVEPTDDVGNEILIIDGFPNSCKLVGQRLSIFQIFRAGLGALPE